MKMAEICTREVVQVRARTSVAEAAALMRSRHVGDLVVTDDIAGKAMPLGIVTDRDIVVEVVAAGVDPATLSVGDIMGRRLVTAGETEEISDVLPRMRHEGVRRIPVVDEDGALVGIISLDDLLEVLAQELTDTVRLMSWGRVREQRTRDMRVSG
ncbi:MAG TPA: CBS domain-containing protein [Burkholderiales bacterium]|nr:CBS domain-containing protein [Burkholderiales bacterium]